VRPLDRRAGSSVLDDMFATKSERSASMNKAMDVLRAGLCLSPHLPQNGARRDLDKLGGAIADIGDGHDAQEREIERMCVRARGRRLGNACSGSSNGAFDGDRGADKADDDGRPPK
jgi:hypothetical protein